MDSPEWKKLQEDQLEYENQFKKDAEEYWNGLDYKDQLHAFYSVCSRIYKGDVVDKGSYRYVLYDVFNFDLDSYLIGMIAGYMSIHNAIVDIEEFEELKKENANMKQELLKLQDDGK